MLDARKALQMQTFRASAMLRQCLVSISIKNDRKDVLTKTMVRQAIDALNDVSASLERFMAEIGDVTRFTHRNAITAFAGVAPSPDQSGTHEAKSGPPELRRALLLAMDACCLKMALCAASWTSIAPRASPTRSA